MIRFTPNRKFLTKAYMPRRVELPDGPPLIQVFTFSNVGARQTVERAKSFDADMVIYGMAGFCTDGAGVGAFRFQITHQHGDKTHTFFNKHVPGDLILPTAQKPVYFQHTRLVNAGDALHCELKSIVGNAIVTAQVILLAAKLEKQRR